jgi:tripartite-type tricarboxylate transporter receptor subunit TctC
MMSKQRIEPSRGRRACLRGTAALALAAAGLNLPLAALAQGDWVPDKPVKMVVPFPPGGGADVAARIVAQAVGNKLGQPLIIENRAGAGGAIGAQVVQAAPADGTTLLVASADTHSIYPHVYTKPRFAAQDFVAVAPITRIAYVLMGRPDLPAKNVQEVVALAKKGKLSYATWGAGSAAHAAMSLFMGVADLPQLLHVPYTGSAPAAQALMAGQVDLMMVPMPLAVNSRSKLTVFGVSAQQRSDAMKDVPTLAEQGFPVDAEFWIGVLAPPKTNPAAVATLSRRFQEAVADPEVQKKLRAQGMSPHQATQPEYARYVADEYKRWGEVIQKAGIKIDEQ